MAIHINHNHESIPMLMSGPAGCANLPIEEFPRIIHDELVKVGDEFEYILNSTKGVCIRASLKVKEVVEMHPSKGDFSRCKCKNVPFSYSVKF